MRGLCGVVLALGSILAQEAVYSVERGSPAVVTAPADPGFAVMGDVAYFVALGDTGNELWITDGTAAGTHLVLDYATGPYSGADRVVGAFGGHVLARRTFGEYWLTDGTRAGTQPVLDLPPVDRVLGTIGNRLVFTVAQQWPEHGTWSFSATAGAEQLSTLPATSVARIDNVDYLPVVDGLLGTDGTAAGTLTILSGLGGTPVASNGRFWFTGSGTGFTRTLRVFDPATGTTSANLLPPIFFLGAQLLPVPGGIALDLAGSPRVLWFSDGTVAGTGPVGLPVDDYVRCATWRDRVLLFGQEGVHGTQPWISDATTAGTSLLANFDPPVEPWRFATTPEHTFFFTSTGSATRVDFTNGVQAGNAGTFSPGVAAFAMLGSRLLLRVGNDVIAVAVDGAAPTATSLVPPTQNWPSRLDLMQPVAAGGQLVFGHAHAMATAGSLATTRRIAALPSLHDPSPGHYPFDATHFGVTDDFVVIPSWPTGSEVDWLIWDSATGAVATALPLRHRGWVTAVASHRDRVAIADTELVVTDGRTSLRLFPFPAGYAGPVVDSLVITDDAVFGTFFGVLHALDPGSGAWTIVDGNSLGLLLGSVGDRAVYRVDSGRLFASDGGPPEDLGITVTPDDPTKIFAWQGHHWIVANGLFESDGTSAGTHAVPMPADVAIVDAAPGLDADAIYLVATDPVHGSELWRTDGATSIRVTDLIPGVFDGVLSVDACGDRLFLSASDGTDGIEPWISDGTAAGTRRIADLMPGTGSSLPRFVAATGDHAYFTAATPGEANLFAVPLGQLGVAHSERLGQGCPGSNGIPRLMTPTPPRLGDSTFRFELFDGAAFAIALLAVDTETTSVEVGSCRLRSAGGLVATVRTTNTVGNTVWTLAIPGTRELLGLHLTAQVAVVDPFGAGPGVALSTALGCTVGAPR
ncbi:MAG: hypothetical protein KDE27_24735 [Planctomycetes bacterium]|nr:hypothetical protein [Planctomycetota bacterium]